MVDKVDDSSVVRQSFNDPALTGDPYAAKQSQQAPSITGDTSKTMAAGQTSTSPEVMGGEMYALMSATGLSDDQYDAMLDAMKAGHFVSLDAFEKAFAANAPHSDPAEFELVFKMFAADQVAQKGSFDPQDAFKDFPAYCQNYDAMSADAKKAAVILSGVQTEPQVHSLSILWDLISLLIEVNSTMSQTGIVMSKQLTNETAIQDAYMDVGKNLSPVLTKSGMYGKDDNDSAKNDRSLINNTILPAKQQQLQNLEEESSNLAKKKNSEISNTVQAANKIADDISNFLSKIAMMMSSIAR